MRFLWGQRLKNIVEKLTTGGPTKIVVGLLRTQAGLSSQGGKEIYVRDTESGFEAMGGNGGRPVVQLDAA